MQTIKNTIAENFGSAHGLAAKEHQFKLEETPSLSGKVAVVTGGSEGIGYGCTHTLLSNDISKLFILSVSQEVVDGALKSISDDMGEAAAKKVTWYKCDISNWREVKETADKISKNTDRLDILINNAGRGIMSYELTDYGVDRHMGEFPSPLLLPRSPSNRECSRFMNRCVLQLERMHPQRWTELKILHSYEPHGPRNPNISSASPHEKDCLRQILHHPHRRPGIECARRRPLRHQICLPLRT